MVLIEKQRECNKLLEALCKKYSNVQFVDMFSPLLDENGKPRLNDYQKDRLHLSEKGYARWNAVLGPILREQSKASFSKP
jgi:lysophospholipase L1-like esterase